MRTIDRRLGLAVVLGLLLGACRPAATGVPSQTATEGLTAAPPRPSAAAATTTPPARTADPAALTIEALQARSYGGALEAVGPLGDSGTNGFTRTEFAYTSDGLRIAGYASVPQGAGPFPVVIVLHGYDSNYQDYGLLNYTQVYTDDLAAAGFLVLHPNLRSFWPSEPGPNPLCTGFVVDVLNLIAIVEAQAGQPGLLAAADPARIGLWGHSMGGGIAQRVTAISPAVDAVVVYASMPSDERINVEQVYPTFRGDLCEVAGLALSEGDFARISALDQLEQSEAAVFVAHGDSDPVVPLEVSQTLCRRLEAAGRTFACDFYPGQGHAFTGEADESFRQAVVDFYAAYLQ
ncbi:MAG TPA: alpha/beta fold hydrolase [Anaerolineaceae bacterium]|nr:alpha/beta fold hydrolase [Anaerolineaceae bacterium]